jgi:hypothetical protein
VNFWHHGARGDVVLGLLFIKTVGGGALYLPAGGAPHAGGPNPSDGRLFSTLKPLVEQQPYITHVRHADSFLNVPEPRWTWNWNWVHSHPAPNCRLLHNHFAGTGINCPGYSAAPWVTVEPDSHGIEGPFVVVARSLRYQFYRFDWKAVLAKDTRQKVFLGLGEEHRAFTREFGPIKRVKVPNLLKYAQLLAAADDVYCNPTLAMALCQAMGKRHYIENSIPTSASGEPNEITLPG